MGRIVEVDPFTINVPSNRARSFFKEEQYNELKKSLKEAGLKVPLQVYENENGELILAEGEWRLKAICEMKWERVKVEIIGKGGEKEAMLDSIATSIKGRPDWVSIAHCMHELGKKGVKDKEFAKALGKVKSYVSMIKDLVKLAGDVQIYISQGLLEWSKGYELSRIGSFEIQRKLAHECMERPRLITLKVLRNIVNEIVECVEKRKLSWETAYERVRERHYAFLRELASCDYCGERFQRRDLKRLKLCETCYKDLLETSE